MSVLLHWKTHLPFGVSLIWHCILYFVFYRLFFPWVCAQLFISLASPSLCHNSSQVNSPLLLYLWHWSLLSTCIPRLTLLSIIHRIASVWVAWQPKISQLLPTKSIWVQITFFSSYFNSRSLSISNLPWPVFLCYVLRMCQSSRVAWFLYLCNGLLWFLSRALAVVRPCAPV